MDDRLEKALDHANYKHTLVQQKENIKLRFQNATILGKNGGFFTVTPQLIVFVDTLIKREHTDTVLIDDKETPIHISDLEDFLGEAMSLYAEATNEYYTEYEKIRKARNVKSIVGL